MKELMVLKSSVANELEKLRGLIDEAGRLQKKRASNIVIRAGGSLLHDFYTGVENIFHAIATTIDESIPTGMGWHVDLLNQMTLEIENIRTHVISKNTAKMLEEYLRFRHLFRKRYGFELEWPQIKTLLKRMPAVYEAVKDDLNKALQEMA